MSYLTMNWGYPWIALAALAVILVHERGLRALNARSTASHAAKHRRKMWYSYAGIVVLTLSVVSPLQYWSMEYFWVHMIQHITVMLAAPALYVAGAPAIPILHAVPVTLRRRLLRHMFLRSARHPVRSVVSTLFSPFFSIVFFNVVMVVWMLPRAFNFVMAHADFHIGVMLSSFFISGVLFWFQFIPSAPWHPTLTPFARVGTLLITNFVMIFISMALSILASGPYYHLGNSMLGMAGMSSMQPTTLNPFADQQIGAAILWVCGDFWCLPAMIAAFRIAIHTDTGSNVMDRVLKGRRTITAEEFRTVPTDKWSQ